ncbi:MAG: HEAT repeat domain-containing protein [Gemmatimonadaceae bacterium]|jgi:HEAT repeat protein|nr:HEAT repeat domain-containing protein [Gemmatimonadaceae bacterium]
MLIPLLTYFLVPGLPPTVPVPEGSAVAGLVQPADPAGALERQARRAMATGENREAARLYRELRTTYARSSYAADAYYWEAFALYRAGGETNLRAALEALVEQRTRWPKAPTREDAVALETRVEGALARYGDARSMQRITAKAEVAERPERPERPERLERPERAERPERGESATTPDGCTSEDDDDRVAALNALMQMDGERALPVLKKVMARRDRCSVTLRRKAVFLISQKRSADAGAMLIDAVRNDPDAEVRQQAVFWLGQGGGDEAVTVLSDLVRTSRDPEVRKKAIFSLAQTRSARASTALRETALDPRADEDVRNDAIFWLSQSSGRRDESVSTLTALYDQLDRDALKDRVLFALSQVRSPASATFLRQVARNEKEPLERRETAIFWFSQSSGSADELMGIYREATATKLREKVIFALSQKGRDPKAIDHLLAIAKSDPDRELRKNAVFWLSQSKDPRVAAFLQELIDK